MKLSTTFALLFVSLTQSLAIFGSTPTHSNQIRSLNNFIGSNSFIKRSNFGRTLFNLNKRGLFRNFLRAPPKAGQIIPATPAPPAPVKKESGPRVIGGTGLEKSSLPPREGLSDRPKGYGIKNGGGGTGTSSSKF